MMIAADRPIQRPTGARLLALDAQGRINQLPRLRLVAELLRRGDLVVANDAATLPASLAGVHLRSGAAIEVRLAGRASLAVDDIRCFSAVVFGEGDWRTLTEERPLPPPLLPGDVLQLGPLQARIERTLGHPRLVALRLAGTPDGIWAGIARHGRPIQYAHLREPLALWDVWTPIAGEPVAFEPPSAGFVLDWQTLDEMRERGIGFATLTHAAGISSTGDAALDARLPFDEPYRIPAATAQALAATRAQGGRVIAIGTTVVRALEHAASRDGRVHAGEGLADQRITAGTRLRAADAIVSGTHEPGASHYELLRAFAREADLRRADAMLQAGGYRTHEFGDSVWIERARTSASGTAARTRHRQAAVAAPALLRAV
ncbi:MAG TPA: S-adenosylmethionine:tRNA ribosyltransferase-isomerase [Methylibium sp.]